MIVGYNYYGVCTPSRGTARIDYTTENYLSNRQFNHDIKVVQPRGSVFLDYMEKAAAKRDVFK